MDGPAAEAVAGRITEAGGAATAHVLDVREIGRGASFADRVTTERGRVDVLVNNVGDYRPMVPFRSSSEESWFEMYRVNLGTCSP